MDEKDLLDRVLMTSLNILDIETKDVSNVAQRSTIHEVQLIVMRFLSVLMSKSKPSKVRHFNAFYISYHASINYFFAHLLSPYHLVFYVQKFHVYPS